TQVEQRTIPLELRMASPELPGGHRILEQYLDSGYSPSAAAGSSSVSTTSRSRICSPTPSFFHSFTSSLNDATVSGWAASHPGSTLGEGDIVNCDRVLGKMGKGLISVHALSRTDRDAAYCPCLSRQSMLSRAEPGQSKQPGVGRTQDKRPRGSEEAPSCMTRIQRWPEIATCLTIITPFLA